MRLSIDLRIPAVCVLAISSLYGGAAAAQSKPAAQDEYKTLIYSVKGPDLFRAHCAPCHGSDGRGNGPAAAALKEKPADLTALAKNNGGKFPAEQTEKAISGEDRTLLAHGSVEMPVWGPIFHQIEEDRDFGKVRLQNLVKYLQSIQQK